MTRRKGIKRERDIQFIAFSEPEGAFALLVFEYDNANHDAKIVIRMVNGERKFCVVGVRNSTYDKVQRLKPDQRTDLGVNE